MLATTSSLFEALLKSSNVLSQFFQFPSKSVNSTLFRLACLSYNCTRSFVCRIIQGGLQNSQKFVKWGLEIFENIINGELE